jgi:predicted DNA binding CopG/RHH family protein
MGYYMFCVYQRKIDLDRLKQKAAYKGLPYQTFIASVLHEYAAGHFKEII